MIRLCDRATRCTSLAWSDGANGNCLVKTSGAQRAETKCCTDIFRGQIVDVGPTVYTIQLVGTIQIQKT